jgi:Histidine-specific methyltransferase, SAM-dependent/TIR domain
VAKVFISHASADRRLVDEFRDKIVHLGSGVGAQDVFYSSGPDTGVPSGEDLNAYVRRQARDARLVIVVLTPAFERSAYCIAELGAAWASSTPGALFPIKVPAMSNMDLGGVLRGVAVRSMDDPAALDELHQRLVDAVGGQSNAQTWGNQRARWVDALAGLCREEIPDAPFTVQREPGERHAWGDLLDTLVDAALYLERDHVARADIETHIKAGTVIPSRYHYSSDVSAQIWIARCKDPKYYHQRNTTRFWADARRGGRFADRVREEIGSDTFDYVSLGPGDGVKDADLVFNWLEAGIDLFYYPYDVSFPLAIEAANTVRARAETSSRRDSLHIKAALGDFLYFDKLRQVFLHRTAPNVVALLGTLGNLKTDLGFLRYLRDTMNEGDLLMLEVRLRSEAKVSQLDSPPSNRHDFGPLEHYLGMKFDQDLMHESRETDLSEIPGTETIVVTYFGPVPESAGPSPSKVTLQYIHLYDPDAFLEAVGDVEDTGFELVRGAEVVNRKEAFLECLLRRRRTARPRSGAEGHG